VDGFVLQMKIHGKNRNLGTMESDRTAAVLHDLLALKFHGGFAQLNFPGNQTIYERVICYLGEKL